MKKLTALVASVLLSASLAVADDITVEAVVIELPNAMADALASQGRKGDAETWKKVVSPDGESLDKEKIKVIARFEAKQFTEGRAMEVVKHEQPGGIVATYSYRVDARKPEESTRWIGISSGKGGTWLGIWSFDLSAPLSAEWNFSARHRTQQGSRIVLEKSSGLADLEQGGFKWTGVRMLERDSGVGSRETKIDPAAFAEDPDEYYRAEWRHRKGDVQLGHQDTRQLGRGGSVLDVGDSARSFMIGETTRLSRKSGSLMGMVRTEKDGGGKGSSVKIVTVEYNLRDMEADTTPVAFQRPAEQRETTWKDSMGEGKKRGSKTHVQIIAE
jgi:hypothetical protein